MLPRFPAFCIYSPLSHGGHIVPGDQKSFVLPRQASQWKVFLVSRDNMAALWQGRIQAGPEQSMKIDDWKINRLISVD